MNRTEEIKGEEKMKLEIENIYTASDERLAMNLEILQRELTKRGIENERNN